MAGYRFFPAADRRQDEIWDYTLEKWGVEQAEAYIRGLHEIIRQAAEREIQWRNAPTGIGTAAVKVHFVRYRMHFVFFREFDDRSIGVLSILHEAMDLPPRLREDLDAAESG